MGFHVENEPDIAPHVAKGDEPKRVPTEAAVRLRLARERLGLEQDTLAARASEAEGRDIDRSHFSNFEIGQNKGGGSKLRKYLSHGFGVPIGDIVGLMDDTITVEDFVARARRADAAVLPNAKARTYVPDDEYPNRAEATRICEQALADMQKISNAEGDKPMAWWLDRFAKLISARADAARRVDDIVSGGDGDLFDVKPEIGPVKRKR
jgi:transcriptional regulator with XRE-family HTH domain